MSYTVSSVKTDLERKLHGTTLQKLNSVNNLLEDAARIVIAEIDPAETRRTAQITNAVYDDIFDYSAPSDLKGNKVLDIRPQVRRTNSDNFSQLLAREFDLTKPENTFHVRWNDGTKTLRLSKALGNKKTVHTMDSVTANGTWAGASGATNLTADTLNYITGSASINFDISTATVPYIENSNLTAVDLSAEEDQGALFVRVYLPTVTNLTNLILRWGSDSSNYWHSTVTAGHTEAFKVGWNVLRFDWNGATEVGTGVSTAIDYLRLTVTYSSSTTDTDFRVDNIVATNGEIWEIEYYSKFLFRTSAGTWGETITADTDIINLDTDAYNILTYQAAYLAAQELQGEDAVFDRNYFKEMLHGDGTLNKMGLFELYKKSNVSETIKPKSTYYRMR